MQSKSHHLWNQHRYRLSQHGRFGLDTTDPPSQYTQAVDHGGV